MPLTDTRHDQRFPTLDTAQVLTARRFASSQEHAFHPAAVIFDVGEHAAAA